MKKRLSFIGRYILLILFSFASIIMWIAFFWLFILIWVVTGFSMTRYWFEFVKKHFSDEKLKYENT